MYNITNPEDSGRVIAVWSPIHRQGAVSTTAAMVACYMAESIEDGAADKILVLSNEVYGNPTASFYMTTEDMINGMQEVLQLSTSENLTSPEDIYNNTFSLGNRIDILNCGKKNNDMAEGIEREIKNILNVARSGYKYIVVDTVCGNNDMTTKRILEECDSILMCMPQDKYIFDSWIRKIKDVYPEVFNSGKPYTVLSSKHYEYPEMRYDSMRREFKGKKLYYISLNDSVHTHTSKRTVHEFIKSNMKSKTPDDAIPELTAVYGAIQENIEKVIEKELQEKTFDMEANKTETTEYLKSLSLEDLDAELYDAPSTDLPADSFDSMYEDDYSDKESDSDTGSGEGVDSKSDESDEDNIGKGSGISFDKE